MKKQFETFKFSSENNAFEGNSHKGIFCGKSKRFLPVSPLEMPQFRLEHLFLDVRMKHFRGGF